jgi:hypothetical protein
MSDKPLLYPLLCLVARCPLCGAISAGSVITDDRQTAKELGRIVQKALRGFRVEVDYEPVNISGCKCTDEQRIQKRLQYLFD